MTYTIWLCCNFFEQYDEKQECLNMAAAHMNSDGHTVEAVEGPNGEDLLEEAEEVEKLNSKLWQERSAKFPKPIGDIFVKGPKQGIEGKEVIYSDGDVLRQMARYTAIYGVDRVKYVKRSD